MSQRAWMLVVVALSSWAAVSETTAQGNRFEFTSAGIATEAHDGTTGFEAATNAFSQDRTAAPFDTADEREPFDQLEGRGRMLDRPPGVRRQGQATAVIRAVQQSSQHRMDEQSGGEFDSLPDSNGPGTRYEPRLAQNTNSTAGGLPVVNFSRQGRGDAATTPRTEITQQDVDASYLDRDFQSTKPTSLLGTEKNLIDSQALNSNLDVPLRRVEQQAGGSALASAAKNGQQKLENAMDLVSNSRPVPFWLTLGLFISLPANLFFGWIAMSMHARYQDLLADISASESRLSRESRRRRARAGDRDDSDSRTRREHEQQAFLQGGIEV